MLKKTCIICLLCCFLTTTVSVKSMAYYRQPDTQTADEHIAHEIAALKQQFYDATAIRKKIVAHKLGNTELSEQELLSIRKTIVLNLKTCIAKLNSTDFQSLGELLRQQGDRYVFPEKASGISAATIIGFPVGFPVWVVSWIIYYIAKSFEKSNPNLGLILFWVSVVMEYFGLYFIL